MQSAMVLQGENRGSLAITRSLGKRKIKVFVGSGHRLSMSAYSKYCHRAFYYRLYDHHNTEKTHNEILANIRKYRPDVLFTINNLTTYIVLKHLKEYEKYCNVIPNVGFEKFTKFSDKATQLELAKKAGCPIPKTLVQKCKDDISSIAERAQYPVLLKPIFSAAGRGIIKVNNVAELTRSMERLNSLPKTFYYDSTKVLVQEYIPGTVYTVAGFFYRGNEIACVVFENLLHISEFGQPVINKTVEQPRLRKIVIDMLSKFKWHGPFNIQMVFDQREDTFKLLDFNPRLWAPLESTIRAGIDAPFLLYQMALGKKVEKIDHYTLNQTFRFSLWWEIPFLFRATNRFDLFAYLRGVQTDFDRKDPLPHGVHLLAALRYGSMW
mgnify:CR=1 FL=1